MNFLEQSKLVLIVLEDFCCSNMLLFLFLKIIHHFSDLFFLILLLLDVSIQDLTHLDRAFILSQLLVALGFVLDHRLVLLDFGN